MTEREQKIFKLREETGCSLSSCVQAFDYAETHNVLPISFLKAKFVGIATPKWTFDERVKYFDELERKRK